MSTRTLKLNDNTQVPWLAFGTGTALFGKDASNAIRVAIQTGITHLDGAQVYNNEETLGEGIRLAGKPRSELFITTKLNFKANLEEQTVKALLEESLKKLGVDYVDLFLIHSPHPPNETPGLLKRVWKQMEALKESGLSKSVGVSNFRVQDLEEILDGATIIPSVNQIELHPYTLKAAQPILDLCKERGITIASYGGLTSVVRAPGGPVDSVVSSIAERLGKTAGRPVSASDVLTKWLLAKDALVVTTTSKEERIRTTLDSINLPDLTAEEIESIDSAGKTQHKRMYMKQVFGP
ncbi:NADP-dependent oxidoreductase domain-containing protein [Mycena floridula]|nr:NADP-dependent oxidoreductase domain-containing protein [Mycena floridula]